VKIVHEVKMFRGYNPLLRVARGHTLAIVAKIHKGNRRARVSNWKEYLTGFRTLFLAALLLALSLSCVSAQGEARLPGTPLSLAYDATTGTLWGVSSEGVYRSDSGANWKPVPIDPGTATPMQLFVDPHAGGRLYQIGPELGVLHSNDAGQTWQQIGEGLPSKNVGAFAVNSVEEGTLYTWIRGQGLFRTRDAGTTWNRMDDGPPTVVENLEHSSLPGSMNTGWLYAATPEGVYLSMD
jgi:photosystem II stability/assembly factor-like uncharacterized protein